MTENNKYTGDVKMCLIKLGVIDLKVRFLVVALNNLFYQKILHYSITVNKILFSLDFKDNFVLRFITLNTIYKSKTIFFLLKFF